MVHVNDPPAAFTLFTQRCTPGKNNLFTQCDPQIILNPDCISNRVMRSRRDGEMSGWIVPKIAPAIVFHAGIPTVVVAVGREHNDCLSKTLSKLSFVGPVKSFFTAEQLLMQFSGSRLSVSRS